MMLKMKLMTRLNFIQRVDLQTCLAHGEEFYVLHNDHCRGERKSGEEELEREIWFKL